MDCYKTKIKPAAQRDIDGYFLWYYEQTKDLAIADGVVTMIEGAIDGLSFKPKLHAFIEEFREFGVRRVICGSFVIPFVVIVAPDSCFCTK